MLIFTLLASTVLMTLIGLAVLCVVATQETFQAGTVGFNSAVRPIDAGADTATGRRSDGTLAGDWRTAEVSNLELAERMLDQLETDHARTTELEIAANDRFILRWR